MQIIRDILEPQTSFSFSECTGEALMFHTTLGTTYQGAEDTLKDRHLSYHFIIDEIGTIRQLIDINRGAWHAGVTNGMNVRSKVFFKGRNPNKVAIGVAFVRNGQKEITRAQRDAAVWLTKWIGQQTGVRYNADNMFYHREVTNYNPFSKPPEVANYRQQVVDGIVGYKDNKDAGEKSRMKLYIQYLQLLVELLILRKKYGIE